VAKRVSSKMTGRTSWWKKLHIGAGSIDLTSDCPVARNGHAGYDGHVKGSNNNLCLKASSEQSGESGPGSDELFAEGEKPFVPPSRG
jgi:hypothetical protein